MSVESLNQTYRVRQMAVKHVMNKKSVSPGGEILMADEEAEHCEMTQTLEDLWKA